MSDSYILPLTRAEETGKKPVHLVRAAARIAVIAQQSNRWKCLFIRHQTKGLELPGGAIEPGEVPAQAGLRELSEEAGIRLPPDQPLELIAMVPITDHRGGSWLDIIYSTSASSTSLVAGQEAELPVRWLTEEEIERQVNQQLSSYSAALAALHTAKQ